MLLLSMVTTVATLGVAQVEPPAPSAEYQVAVKCRAYAPVYTPALSSFLSPQQAKTFNDYWITRSERLGKEQGRSAEQVYASTLVIQLKAEEVDGVLAGCLEAWSKNGDRKAPL